MILDVKQKFSVAQAITVVSTIVSTNVIDLGSAGDASDELYLYVDVSEVFDSVEEDATLNVKLYTDSAEGMGTQVLLLESGVIAEATLVAGYRILGVRLPKGCKRYLRLSYLVATHDFITGKVNAGLAWKLDNVKDVLRAS